MKKILPVMLAFVIVILSVVCPSFTVSAKSLYIRKIVSVVYDDSGSMKGDKWAYANYAMQAFCGMMNDEDSLYITYMSNTKKGNHTPQKIDLTAKGIQGSVDKIKNHTEECNSTPFEAVEDAFKNLRSINDADKNTQYWLVVITDGAFDECQSMSYDGRKNFLNKKFDEYTAQVMPNGTKLNVTFMAIGNGVAAPDEDMAKGIYTYSAENSDEITDVMSEMAGRVSSRTRIPKTQMSQPDGKTVRVTSSIPLLNIAVFSQDTSSKLKQSSVNGKGKLSISRQAALSYPGYSDLTAGAYLIGDSKKIIDAGTYDIAFDGEVDTGDIDILFEPALEVRISAMVDGKEITDCDELENVPAGKDVSVLCKVYEMGTDKEIDAGLLPDGTNFEILVYENGQLVKESKGKESVLSGYRIKNSETEIDASVIINGFNPISHSVAFNPGKNVKYSITPGFLGNKKSVRYNKISENKDMAVCFTVSHNGTAITDPEVVKTFNPEITVSPKGNDGTISYSNDGKIIFTPNASSPLSEYDENLSVNVTCRLDNGAEGKATYTVVVAEYEVVLAEDPEKIAKNEFFNNKKSASFYITRDGVKLGKSDVENSTTATLNEAYSELKLGVSVEDDGKIVVTPYSETERKITFGKWWFNWLYYFGLEDSDMNVSISHPLASGEAVIDITEADLKYQILNVYLPLLIELLFIAAIIAYIIRYFTKARFAQGAALYIGSIVRNTSPSGTHIIEMSACELSQYNTFANLWNPFKELTVSISGVSITAVNGGKIMCNETFPWYCDTVKPKSRTIRVDSPRDIVDYCDEKSEMIIHEIKTVNVMDEQSRIITQDDTVYYLVKADVDYAQIGARQTEVINEAVVFCYSTVQN